MDKRILKVLWARIAVSVGPQLSHGRSTFPSAVELNRPFELSPTGGDGSPLPFVSRLFRGKEFISLGVSHNFYVFKPWFDFVEPFLAWDHPTSPQQACTLSVHSLSRTGPSIADHVARSMLVVAAQSLPVVMRIALGQLASDGTKPGSVRLPSAMTLGRSWPLTGALFQHPRPARAWGLIRCDAAISRPG